MIFRSDLSLDRGMAALSPRLERLWGFRRGRRGTHSSRTIMLDELTQLLDQMPTDADRDDYAEAVVAGNCLGKPTAATRKASFQRLAELYGLRPRFILFRALRHLWSTDETARPALALLLALARDPFLYSIQRRPCGGRQAARAEDAPCKAGKRHAANGGRRAGMGAQDGTGTGEARACVGSLTIANAIKELA